MVTFTPSRARAIAQPLPSPLLAAHTSACRPLMPRSIVRLLIQPVTLKLAYSRAPPSLQASLSRAREDVRLPKKQLLQLRQGLPSARRIRVTWPGVGDCSGPAAGSVPRADVELAG